MGDSSRGTVLIWAVAAVLGTLAVLRLIDSGGGGGAGSPVRVDGGAGAESGVAGAEPGGAGAKSGGAGAGPGGAGLEQDESAGAGIFVHVAGAVRRPGLVRVPAGSRVAQAVERAGGPVRKAELAGVNLAARLEDGQQVVVPVRGAGGAGLAAGGSGVGVASGVAPGAAGAPKLSLATASVDQLDELDGIGPTLAQRIVEYRTEHGGFRSLEELREVDGIGEKRFESLGEALQP